MTDTPLERRFDQLQQRLAVMSALTGADVNAATDFAIDANAAHRADLTLALLEPLTVKAANVAKVWQLIGLAARYEQAMETAAKAFARAAQLAPQDPRIALGKAQVAFESGEASADQFIAVRRIAPQDGELALSTAAALVQEGRSGDGVALVTDLIRQNPGWLRGHEWLASNRWISGDPDYAGELETALTRFPDDPALYLALYRAVSQVEDWSRAQAILASARARLGDRIEWDAAEAHIATESGADDHAQALFSRLADLADPGVALSEIRHCLRTGRVDRAEKRAHGLLGGPAARAAWPYMGTIWRLLGDPRAAWLDGDPSFVRHFDLPLSHTELDQLATLLRRLHLSTHAPPEQSLRGGTQTQGHLFLRTEPQLLAIRAHIVDAVRAYVDALPAHVEGHPLLGTLRGAVHFEGAWSVRLGAQGFHVVHTHPVGWISSALYVALPDDLGAAPAGWLELGAPPPDLRLDLAPYLRIEPKPGRLALFPSTMWHGTVPFDDGERLTIAFDIRTPSR